MRRLLILLAVLVPAALCAPAAALAAPTKPVIKADTSAYVGDPVNVTLEPDESAAGVTYAWSFEGGTPVDGVGPASSTTFGASGQFSIAVVATDALGDTTASDPHVIRVGPKVRSSVDFTVSNTEPVVGETITVEAPNPVDDYEAEGYSCRWTADSPAAIAEPGECRTAITWAGPGTKDVTLRVADLKGAATTKTRAIKVGVVPTQNQPPSTPSLSYSPADPIVGQRVTFTSKATDPDGTIESYEWDFNSDNVYEASGETASHVFPAAGNYTVTVRATDNNGGFKTSFQTIFVSSPPAGEVLGTSNSGSPPTASTPSSGQGQPRQSARLLSPFPIVRLRGSVVGRTARINLLSIQGAPRGAKVRVRCRGGGCPRRLVTSTARSSRRTMRLRSFERRLRAGARLEIWITQTRRLGKYTRFDIRRGAAPRRVDRCVRSFPGKPVACPDGD